MRVEISTYIAHAAFRSDTFGSSSMLIQPGTLRTTFPACGSTLPAAFEARTNFLSEAVIRSNIVEAPKHFSLRMTAKRKTSPGGHGAREITGRTGCHIEIRIGPAGETSREPLQNILNLYQCTNRERIR
jgi:hypothetical protein